ncbi:MAG: hypothetical protein ACP5JJ_02545 [Anaerolineae bacterium]
MASRASSDRGTPVAPWGWVLALLLTVFAIAPLTYPGFFEANSGFLPAFNAAHPQDAPAWGRPVPPIQGEGKLPYLIAWPFFRLSGSGAVAVRWGYGLAFALGALGTYAWSRRWLGTEGAGLASAIYTYLPWHLSTVYEWGAYAEAWLWAFWPWLLWSIDRLSDWRLPARIVALVASLLLLAASLWTQPGLALLALPLLLAYGIIADSRRRQPAVALAVVLALAILLLWILGRLATVTAAPFQADYLYPFQLLAANWGLGNGAAQPQPGSSFQLGIVAAGLAVVALALWLADRQAWTRPLGESGPPPRPLGLALRFWALALAVLLFLTLPWSAFVWQGARLQALVVHPWQVLALAGLPLAFLAGALPRLDRRLATLPAWAGLLSLFIVASYFYLAPSFTQVEPGPEPVALFQPVDADQPQVILLDYDLDVSVETTSTLTLTWQAVAPVPDDYTVFVHALQDGEKVAQRDSRPCDGVCPTDTWQPGQILIDRHPLTLPAAAPPTSLRLAVGLYLLDSGQRAAVASGGDMVILDVR